MNRPVEDFEKWCCPPKYIIDEDGTARRVDGKPLNDYDRGWLAAENKMQYHIDWSREQRYKMEEERERIADEKRKAAKERKAAEG
jgi:hypothetical protein